MRVHKGAALVTLEGIDTREEVEQLVGRLVLTDEENLPPKAKDEYYWSELIGMKVVDNRGNSYGVIKRIIETGANDVYVSETDENEYYIPAVKEVIVDISRDDKSILIDPPEGLFEDD